MLKIKAFLSLIRYALVGWPGDQNHVETNHSIQIAQPSTSTKHSDKMKKASYRSHPYNRFHKHKNETSENDEDKRSSTTKSRYFSIENLKIINQSEQSRKLPDATCENTIQTVAHVSLPTKIPPHFFQDEFIPLSKDKYKENQESNEESESSQNDSVILDESSKRKDYNPKLNSLESYKGPYPIKCLMRTRQYLIDCFKPYSTVIHRSNSENRRFEILKMKMNIRSKFDDDAQLWRKIKRETAIEQQLIYDRIESQNRRYQDYMQKLQRPQSTQHTYMADETSSSSSSEEETTDSDCVFEKSVMINDKKIVQIALDDDDEDEHESNNLMKIFSNVDTYENLDYKEDENDDKRPLDTDEKDNDPHSKRVQFGNLSKTKYIRMKKFKIVSFSFKAKSYHSKKKQKTNNTDKITIQPI